MTIEQPPPERETPPGPPEPEEPQVPPEMPPPPSEPEWRTPGEPEITDAPMRLPSENPDVETEL